MTVTRKFLTLADADDVWRGDEDNVWFYDVEPLYDAVSGDGSRPGWRVLLPMGGGGFSINPGEPNEDVGPFEQILFTYRGNDFNE